MKILLLKLRKHIKTEDDLALGRNLPFLLTFKPVLFQ